MSDGQVRVDVIADNKPLDKSLNESEQKIDGFGKSASKRFLGLSVAIGTAFATAGAAVIKFGSEFETGIAKASTLFGEVNVNSELLKEQLLDVSDATGETASNLTEGLYNALSAGIPITEDAAEAVDFLEKSARLAKAGFTDTNTVVGATSKILNAYGLELSETDRIQGILIQTQNQGITTVGELSSVLANVTPTAAATGVSFEQLAASIALLTRSGVPAAQATTQLNALFSELSASGSKADQALRRITSGTEALTDAEVSSVRASNTTRIRELSKTLDKQLSERQKALSKERDLLKDSLDEELDLIEKNRKEALKGAEEELKVKKELINEEFLERLKLIDEERFNRIKAVQDEIDGINQKTEEEEARIKLQEQEEERVRLNRDIEEAQSAEERQEAVKALSDFEDAITRERLLAEREAQIENLEQQKTNIEEEFDLKEQNLKDEFNLKEEQAEEDFDNQKAIIEETFDLEKKALEETQKLKLEQFDEARDTEIEGIRDANQERIDALTQSQGVALKAAQTISGGMGFQELLASGMSLSEILQLLADDAEKSGLSLLDYFGSVEAGKAALGLTGEAAEEFDRILAEMGLTAGVVDDAFNQVSNTTEERFNKNINELKNIAIELFDVFKVGLNAVFDFIDALKAGNPIVRTITILLGSFAVALGAYSVAQTIATAEMTIGAIAAGALGTAINFLTAPITLVILAIGALIAATLLIIDNWDVIKEFVLETWQAISDFAVELWGTLSEFFTTTIDKITTFFTESWNNAKEAFFTTLTAIKEFFIIVWEGIRDFYIAYINFLKTIIVGGFTSFIDTITGIFDLWLTSVETVIDTVKKVFSGIIDFIKNVFTGDWESAWDNIVDIFGTIFDGIKALVKEPLNFIIDKINDFIEGVNEIKIPEGVPLVGGISFNIPKIPRLQRGGLAFGDTLAMIGDNPDAATNPEVIAPLSKLEDLVFNQTANVGLTQAQPIMLNVNSVVEVDGEQIATITLQNLDDARSFLG